MVKYKVNLNNWLMKLYMHVRQEGEFYLPTDTCALRGDMFYTLTMALVTLPTLLISKYILNKVDPGGKNPPVAMYFGFAVFALLIIAIIGTTQKQFYIGSDYYIWMTSIGVTSILIQTILAWFIAPVIFVLSIGIVTYIAFGILELSKRIPKAKPKKEKKESITKKLYSDYRKKVCTPIEYTRK